MFGKLKQSVYKVNTYGEQDKSGENRSNIQQLAQCLHTTEYGTVHSYVQCSIFEAQCTKYTVVSGSTLIVCKLIVMLCTCACTIKCAATMEIHMYLSLFWIIN